MAIEKMLLVNLHGPVDRLDETLSACSDACCFHPEPVTNLLRSNKSMQVLEQENPYTSRLERVRETASLAGIPLKYDRQNSLTMLQNGAEDFLDQLEQQANGLAIRHQELVDALDGQGNVVRHLEHIEGMDVSLDELFACRFVKIRVGRLPKDSFPKLSYYDNEIFFFHEFDYDGEYYWGIYLTTEEYEAVVDNIFSSLYFERIFIPEYAHGTPRSALTAISAEMDSEREQLHVIEETQAKLVERYKSQIDPLYSRLLYLQRTYEIRKYVAISSAGDKQSFHMVGFIPESERVSFEKELEAFREVTVNFMPPETDERYTPPTRLKNNVFSRPFEMFVTMYGLPSNTDIDPTPFVAITYSILFGAMFGDLGQGILLSLIGLFVTKKWKTQLGGIMTRIGIFSAVFGLLYGSVFGNEEILEPLYKGLGFASKPITVMDGATINQILLVAVAAGAFLIIFAILINIVQGIRTRDTERTLLSANGIAGLVMYVAILVGLVMQLFLNKKVFVPLYIIVFIVIPALLIFCHEPINLLLKRAKSIAPEDGFGGYFVESFFELFEVALSFATNTMSFLRVGGFVLSHAGMMVVVMTLSEMVGGAGSIPVIILGNIFVMALEGLIVGIQVLRLEFYEMFSRFYTGEGVPFEPISLTQDSTPS